MNRSVQQMILRQEFAPGSTVSMEKTQHRSVLFIFVDFTGYEHAAYRNLSRFLTHSRHLLT